MRLVQSKKSSAEVFPLEYNALGIEDRSLSLSFGFQAAAPSKEEVMPLLAADTLAPESAAKPSTQTTGPSSVAEQLDAMKSSEPSLLKAEPVSEGDKAAPKTTDTPAKTEVKSSNFSEPPVLTSERVAENKMEPENPVSDSVPGTEIAPDHSGKTSIFSTRIREHFCTQI